MTDTHNTLEEKELEILRKAVDKAERKSGRKLVESEQIQNIISIVENFIRRKKLVCYGGTAINNILPVEEQFYDRSIELPDYDFFSSNALNDAKELADIYYENGYTDVEAKAGVHVGTYKVFVSFIPVADITFLDKKIYNELLKDTIKINGILYAPPNYLRMAMYLELSRPEGDVSRWEKVLKRLTLLNKHYPMKNPKCDHIDFMRSFEGNKEDVSTIYYTVKGSFIDQGLVFFGGYASSLYGKYMPSKYRQKILKNTPDFDVLSNDPYTSAVIVKERLEDEGFDNVKVYKKPPIGELIDYHYELAVGNDSVAFIYKPPACHSYNVIRIGGKKVKIATIDTMLSFYLAFLYSGRNYYDVDRIICMAQYLLTVQIKNRLKQSGILKRFTLSCYGKQETLSDVRNEKAIKYKDLKEKKNTEEYEKYFLRYLPHENQKKVKKTIKNTNKKNKRYTRKNK
jgi:hypothetical protein